MEIKLKKRYKYAGDVYAELIKNAFTPSYASELIDKVPDADVAHVVHGKWEYKEEWGRLVTYTCSICGQMLTTKHGRNGNYCPNCGAKMDLEG